MLDLTGHHRNTTSPRRDADADAALTVQRLGGSQVTGLVAEALEVSDEERPRDERLVRVAFLGVLRSALGARLLRLVRSS